MSLKLRIQDHLLTAIRASIEAGRSILAIYSSDFDAEMKGDRTPLTLADKRSHAIIARRLQETGFPILSEEGRKISYEERKGWNLFWIVDPLDGTKEFIKRNGEFTVNIALIEARKPILGVIFVPVQDILYFAFQGLGSFKLPCGGSKADLDELSFEKIMALSLRLPLPPSPPSPLALTHQSDDVSRPLIIIGSRSHATPELMAFVENKRKECGKVTLISAGSSLKFCLVAEGKADIYPRLGPTMEWDTAAGQAIAENAGRKVLVWGGKEPLRYNRQDLLNPWFVVL